MAPRYFGFYANGSFSLDNVDETASYSNLDWINAEDPGAKAKIERSRRYGNSVVVDVSRTLFDYPSVNPRPDGPSRFLTWWATLGAPLQDSVWAILLADEPWRHAENQNLMTAKRVTVNLDMMAMNVASWIGKPTMVSAAGNEFDGVSLPQLVDVLAMYRYSHNTWSVQLTYSFFKLLARKKSRQSILAVVDSYERVGKPLDQDRIISFNDTWKWLIRNFGGSVIGVAPFLYQSTPEMGQGAESMPQVLSYMQAWGREIVGPKPGVA